MENNTDQYKIAQLIFLELKGELTEADKEILEKWKSESVENSIYYNKIIDENSIKNKISAYHKIDSEKAWLKLDKELGDFKKTEKIHLNRIIKYVAAACVLFALAGYFFLNQQSHSDKDIVLTHNVISSGTQKAVLKTSNNQRFELGELKQKNTFQLTNTSATDSNFTLTYQNIEAELLEELSEITINTLETPRGGEYSLILSDGSKVYLNAETKLTFPEIFAQDIREVQLEGEAYFEITKSESKPFIVKTPDYQIQVYGTSFNVSAYPSDNSSRTTLVEGSVGLNTNNGEEIRLSPSEQAFFNKADNSIQTKIVDLRIYTSWKEGKFMFDNESLEDIMQKLGRWYNVETNYLDENLKHSHFTGTLDRQDEIVDILNMIAFTTNIKFNINGNTIEVSKKK